MDLSMNIASRPMPGIANDIAAAPRPETQDARPAARDFTVTMRSEAPKLEEPTITAPDSELVRDDALGKLVKFAFSLPPPPAPAFE